MRCSRGQEDCVVIGWGGRQSASEALEPRLLRNVWPTVLVSGNDLLMINNRMNLRDKRLRSKAPSAARLSPYDPVRCRKIGFDLPPILYSDTVSGKGEGVYNVD
jgi:hypothetical protein